MIFVLLHAVHSGRFSYDEDETRSFRNVVSQKNAEYTKDRACEKRGNLRENENNKEINAGRDS